MEEVAGVTALTWGERTSAKVMRNISVALPLLPAALLLPLLLLTCMLMLASMAES